MTSNNLVTEYGLDALAAILHETAIEKGFWDGTISYDKVGNKLALVHSEVTEVLEAIRKNKGEDQIVEELADIIIRTLDLYNGMHNQGDVVTSLHKTVKRKSKVNKDRPRLHGTLG
jgi:NTP pyrophosphatase (non-canonical NTP hydrolase)